MRRRIGVLLIILSIIGLLINRYSDFVIFWILEAMLLAGLMLVFRARIPLEVA